MKFLKTYKLFENEHEFNIGDYVKIGHGSFSQNLKDFFKVEIGQITNIDPRKIMLKYTVKFFKTIPNVSMKHFIEVTKDELDKPDEDELNNYLKIYAPKEEYEKFLINKKAAKYNII